MYLSVLRSVVTTYYQNTIESNCIIASVQTVYIYMQIKYFFKKTCDFELSLLLFISKLKTNIIINFEINLTNTVYTRRSIYC